MNNFPKSITIAFRDRQGLSKRAFVINDYLLVSHFGVDTSKYQLYWRRQKTPVCNTLFTSLVDAIDVARWLCDVLNEFFPILETTQNANLFDMLRYTLANDVLIKIDILMRTVDFNSIKDKFWEDWSKNETG